MAHKFVPVDNFNVGVVEENGAIRNILHVSGTPDKKNNSWDDQTKYRNQVCEMMNNHEAMLEALKLWQQYDADRSTDTRSRAFMATQQVMEKAGQ